MAPPSSVWNGFDPYEEFNIDLLEWKDHDQPKKKRELVNNLQYADNDNL